MIGHPECSKLCFSGEQWRTPTSKTYRQGEFQLRLKAFGFFKKLADAPVPMICLENSHSIFLNKYFTDERYQRIKVQPWQFGDPFQKETHLWLKNLPPLIYTGIYLNPEHACHKASRTENRSAVRAKSYPGIAEAMANQWG